MSAPVERVGVVGCGAMGTGFAVLCARNGLTVTVVSSSPATVPRGRQRLRESLERAAAKGKLPAGDLDAVLDRLSVTADLADLAGCQLVLEAVPEDLDLKIETFSQLDKVVQDPDAILASNTSSIPIIRLARATARGSHVVGMHFFNPVSVMPLVEIVASLLTENRIRDRAQEFATTVLGKEAIVSGDRAGFVVNALLIPYLLSAVRMLESGFATAEDIDHGMLRGCGHPMGPLALVDMIGLDTVGAVADALFDEFKQPLYAPPPLLSRMIDGGMLGRKSGRGFFDYS
ncbi:3-hydroxybutyryl-CoA dehydrogenase [Micromonospora sp. NPDC049274]|uniref:3-hydroxybutyryl-CoA dehydrogenase n=1 Tax=Micromonospora sp. NPDC049274 TaxID=3154829 RepID=UPI00342424CF